MDEDARKLTQGELFYARAFALLAVLGLGFLVYLIVAPFFAPLAWAFFIAFLLHPLHVWLVGKLHGRSNLSAFLLTLATVIILVGPLTALAAAFAAQVAELLQSAQRFASQGGAALPDFATVPVIGGLLEWLERSVNISVEQIQGWLIEGARNALQFLASLGGKIFFGALATLTGFIIAMFVLFFAIRDGRKMYSITRGLVPMTTAHKESLFEHLAAVTRAVVYGTGVTALAQGAAVGVGFAIVGLPSPVVFAVLAALFALLPMVGTPIIWVPAIAVLAIQERWFAALFMLTWGVVLVSVIDNVLRPLLVSGRAEVGTLTVFVGVLGGVSAFGTIGLFLGPLALALVTALIRFTLELRRTEAAKKPSPEEAPDSKR